MIEIKIGFIYIFQRPLALCADKTDKEKMHTTTHVFSYISREIERRTTECRKLFV